jgi:hypothetical protein
MRLIYGSPLVDGSVQGKPVTDSYGAQIVSAIILDGSDMIVLILDNVQSSHYIERVKNRFATDILRADNFEKISDEEHEAYSMFLNLNGLLPGAKK